MAGKGVNEDISQQEKNNKLLEAAKEGDAQNVNKLMDEGAEINKQTKSCLLVSADGGHDQVVNFFLDQGVPVNWDQPGEMTALMRASVSGHYSTTKLLLDKMASMDLQDNFGSTALMHAAERNYPDIVSQLLLRGADQSLKNYGKNPRKLQETALKVAEKNNSNSVIKIFSVYKNDWRRFTQTRGKELFIAAQEGNARLVRGLLIAGSDLDYRDANNDQAIHTAADRGHNAVISVLLEYGANINSIGFRDYTPLLWATRSGQFSTVRFLMENGADMEHKTSGGNTALMWAAKRNDIKIACELLEIRARESFRTRLKLEKAINQEDKHYCQTMAILLSEKKIPLKMSRDKNVAKVLLTATENGNVNVVASLIRRGASIEISNNLGETPFQIATRLPQRRKQEYNQQLESYNRSGVKSKVAIETVLEKASKKSNELANLFLVQKLSRHDPVTISKRVSDIVDHVGACKKNKSLKSLQLDEHKFYLNFSTNDKAKETLLESIVSQGLLKEREEVLELMQTNDEEENASEHSKHQDHELWEYERIKEEVKLAVSSSIGLRNCLESVDEKYPWSRPKMYFRKILSFFKLMVIGSCFYGFDIYTDIRFSQDMFNQYERNFTSEREICKEKFDGMFYNVINDCKHSFTATMCMKSIRLLLRMGEDCFENDQRFGDPNDWYIAGTVSYIHCGLPFFLAIVIWEIRQIGLECGFSSVSNFPLPFVTRFNKFICDMELFENNSWPLRNCDIVTKTKYEEKKQNIMKKLAAIENSVNLSLIIEASVESSFQFFFQTVFLLPNIVLTFTDPDGSLVWTDLFNWKTISILLSFMSFAWAFYTLR